MVSHGEFGQTNDGESWLPGSDDVGAHNCIRVILKPPAPRCIKRPAANGTLGAQDTLLGELWAMNMSRGQKERENATLKIPEDATFIKSNMMPLYFPKRLERTY